MKKASEIFGSVDPALGVIDRGRRSKTKDWHKSGGATCVRCGKEAVRFREGLCLSCVGVADEKLIKDEKKWAKRLEFVKRHNARIDKRKGTAK